MSIEDLYQIFKSYPSVQTDTRMLKEGDIFFALKGANFNGNLFANQALGKGAVYAVVDELVGDINPDRMILVDDVLHTLQMLAKHHRQQFNIPFIAITGSNGKTTTKELIHAVLCSSFKTYTTIGNLNNHIGIPLTLLKIKSDAEMAVIEMGANHQKEIESYCQYALPTHGIITNAGKAHLEGFGGEAGVKKGKGELYDYLRNAGGAVFVMWDYDYLRDISKGIREIFSYGTAEADIIGQPIPGASFLEMGFTKGTSIKSIKTQLVGDYNFPNVLAAVAVGKYFNIADEKIKAAIENYTPTNSRSQMVEKGGNKIIMDAYNANPSSMKAAIENFAHLKQAEKKVLILGAMAELGEESLDEHQSIVELIKKYNWNQVVLVGGDFLKISHPYLSFANSMEAKRWFDKTRFNGCYILVKGSRSMQMEKILE
ncbi:MAG: UDP-N-acetylmuramoyl-tripeptide--D-alanyl-D-alanine ligase [Bacteroidetes bacterium]|nr:UDP-N-acetylmuramoyl-tripeptide--D-alanyl-D-alanine ligase [Bacteroidota bacterium]